MERSEKEGFPITAIREIRILNALRHENIVELKEVVMFRGDEDNAEEMKASYSFSVNDVFMVFEYVDFDLAGLLASPEVHLTPDHVKSYMYQLLDGMFYMHRNGILHRDLKGANLLVTKDNILKIADWGLARSFSPIGKGTEFFEREYSCHAVVPCAGNTAGHSSLRHRNRHVVGRVLVWRIASSRSHPSGKFRIKTTRIDIYTMRIAKR